MEMEKTILAATKEPSETLQMSSELTEHIHQITLTEEDKNRMYTPWKFFYYHQSFGEENTTSATEKQITADMEGL